MDLLPYVCVSNTSTCIWHDAICRYVYIDYVYVYMYVYIYTYTSSSLCMCVKYMRMHLTRCDLQICTYRYMYIYRKIYMYTYTYTHIYIYIYIYIYSAIEACYSQNPTTRASETDFISGSRNREIPRFTIASPEAGCRTVFRGRDNEGHFKRREFPSFDKWRWSNSSNPTLWIELIPAQESKDTISRLGWWLNISRFVFP